MQPDYPAAHSMDTCFFAVDRDGHVAYFETGEAGAAPVEAPAGGALREQLAALPCVPVIHDRLGHTLPGPGREGRGHCSRYQLGFGRVLMFLTSLDAVQEDIGAGRAVQVPASEGVAVLFRGLTEELLGRLHDSGACLGCFPYFHDEAEEEYRPDLAARGFFSYEHLTDNWISGPYGRGRCPAQPIHVDQLPPRIREAVKLLHFDSLCFAQTPHIQPVEHGECVSWEPAYIDASGRQIRPIPGKEDAYASDYHDLARIGDSLNMEVEPPSDLAGEDEGE
jgi:hypothetical protein